MPEVEGDDVTALLDGDLDESVIPVIATMAKSYTRGNGFEGNVPNDEIAAAITTASARMVSNPGQLPIDHTAGPFAHSVRGAFQGWSLAELFVLNRYRKRAM